MIRRASAMISSAGGRYSAASRALHLVQATVLPEPNRIPENEISHLTPRQDSPDTVQTYAMLNGCPARARIRRLWPA